MESKYRFRNATFTFEQDRPEFLASLREILFLQREEIAKKRGKPGVSEKNPSGRRRDVYVVCLIEGSSFLR